MYLTSNSIVFQDNRFVTSSQVSVDFLGQTLHYGYGIFEGIRSYNTNRGVKLFREEEHYQRLVNGCDLLGIPFSYQVSDLCDLTYELLNKNGLSNAYVRPLVYCSQNMSLNSPKNSHLLIAAWEWGNYLGNKPVRLGISKFQRPNPKSIIIEAKACGHYVNSILATQEMQAKGFDEALMLDMEGNVAEASGANIFLEKDGVLHTPALGFILPGITRSVVISVCEELQIDVIARKIAPEELSDADSIFLCGTATEIAEVESVNNKRVKNPWITTLGSKIQDMYKVKVLFGEVSTLTN